MSTVQASSLPESLAHWPGYLLTFIAEQTTERFERALARQEIRTKHASVLFLIDAEGPMSQRALCRRLRIDKSPMVGLVDDLERLGLAERRRSDADRRVQDIHLTARGRTAVARIIALAEEENERTFGVLDDEQRAQLHWLLLQVAEATADRR
ncbi:MAG TPA: MarR family winged helix-turn-helix transcriptional regulator [Solirubrobacteraceae bacterium]|nr:MarR family winged helix-turn-helix transcriptional regulator [Solirubrobacteraceae bacterium]